MIQQNTTFEIIERVRARGWALFDSDELPLRSWDDRAVLDSIGLRPTASRAAAASLRPRTAETARRPSLTARYGIGAFPAHADGAHLPVPPRFVLLRCKADEQGRPTLLYPWHEIDCSPDLSHALLREVFAFKNGACSFVDSVLSGERQFVRLDPGCMIPLTRGARHLLDWIARAIAASQAVTVEWRPGRSLLFDNWRVLHGRGLAQRIGERTLIRTTYDVL